jgi:tetratricopeptide (TPR) repeat protein
MRSAWTALVVLALASPAWSDEAADLKAKILKYNDLTGDDPVNEAYKALARDKALAKKVVAVAEKMLAEKPDQFTFPAALILGNAAESVKSYEAAGKFYGICKEKAEALKSEKKLALAYQNYIDLLFRQKKYEEAIKTCREFLDIESDSEDGEVAAAKSLVLFQMVEAMSRNNQIDEALKLINNFVERDAENWFFYRLKGLALRNAERYDEAAETLTEAIAKVKKARRIPAETKAKFARDLRYLLSNVYIDLKKPEKSVEQLEILVKEEPDNATYHNDLGFVMADNDIRLADAEKYVRKALELDKKKRADLLEKKKIDKADDKDNSAYLDSLGWILFKQKKYAEAKAELLKATADPDDEDGQHVEILDHLADAHMALGEKKEAIEVWKRALKGDSLSKRDDERKKKVEAKLKEAEAKK